MIMMKGFIDSENFKSKDGIPYYDRKLGEKHGLMYKDKKWSDVLMNGVSLDKVIEMDNKYGEMKMSEGGEGGKIMINSREMNNEIKESSRGNMENMKNMKVFRERKIPQGKKKNYPVKPKNPSKDEKNFHHIEEIRDCIDGCVWLNGDITAVSGIGMNKEKMDAIRISEPWCSLGDPNYKEMWRDRNSYDGQHGLELIDVKYPSEGSYKWWAEYIFMILSNGKKFQMEGWRSMSEIYEVWKRYPEIK